MLEIALSLAIVTQDQVPLRAAPRQGAAQHATLWQGESLEIRGQKGDYYQVYDHRRERAGYIRASQVRAYSLKPEEAPEFKAVVNFLKDTPGSESLGIGYAAAFLKVAPAEAIDAEIFDALGGMADRLARRASGLTGQAAETAVQHVDVAAVYGVNTVSFERNGKAELCYDGEASRRVLALPADGEQKGRAALALTRDECVDPALTPTERFKVDVWRGEILDSVSRMTMPDVIKNRVRMRKAGVYASLAYQYARQPEMDPAIVMQTGRQALDTFLSIDKNELVDGDLAAYNEAAIRVGASRWAAEAINSQRVALGKPGIALVSGQPGQTCINLIDEKHGVDKPLLTRCTYSVVWPASLSISRDGKALALAVQPLDTWRELWVFRQDQDGWHVDVLPPALDEPSLGYIEFAGWVPGNKQVLASRDIKTGRITRTRFELLNLNTLEVEKSADKPANLTAFYRWQDPLWKGGTVAVR